MAVDEIMQLREELASLQRVVHGMHRMGRVHKVEKGRIRVTFGQGDVGDENGQDTSTWIRTSHGGAQSHSEDWAIGESVHVFSAGGNMEHAHVLKGGYNDKHPMDGNDDKGNSTRRWRKPPDDQGQQQDQDQSGDGGGSSQGQYGDQDKNPAPQWKDDDSDHQEINTNTQRQHKLGKYSYTATKDGGTMKFGDLYVKVSDGKVEIGNGSTAAFTFDGSKIVVQAPIQDKNGKKFAVQGTMDSRGDTLLSKFANE